MSVTTPALIEAMRRISELLRAGSYCAAHDELETIVAANPTFVEALRLLAGAKQALGDPATAEELLRSAVRRKRSTVTGGSPPPRRMIPPRHTRWRSR